MEQLTKNLGKYVITIILVGFGLIFLGKYISGDELESQPVGMLISSLVLIIVGVLISPNVLGKVKSQMSVAVLGIGVVLGGFLAYSVYDSIAEEIRFQEMQDHYNGLTIQRLKDIREAEEAYVDFNGTFTDNFDTLFAWIKEPVIPIPFKMGTFHDSIPSGYEGYAERGLILKRADIDSVAGQLGMEVEVFRSAINGNQTAYKVVDTIYTTFYAENFTPEARKGKKLPPVSLDSLPFSPYKGERFIIKTGTVEQSGVQRPTILVQDPTPFGREKVKKDTLRFGSLTEAITDGSWK